MKYKFTTVLKPVVEFVRKDAGIRIDLDGRLGLQKVIGKNYKTVKEAEDAAEQFCTQLQIKIDALVLSEIQHLKTAMP